MDANVSVSQDSNNLGTRTELKNIGSIKSVAAAIKYEIKRHISIIEQGGTIVNETRAWDADKHRTVVMREKEEKQVLDYSYFIFNEQENKNSHCFRIIVLCQKTIYLFYVCTLMKVKKIQTI